MTELFKAIMFGMLAFTLPLASYVAYLDFMDWRRTWDLLPLARWMTRVGWVVSLGAIAARWAFHLPPVEASDVAPVFFVGLTFSCFGFLGVAINYHREGER